MPKTLGIWEWGCPKRGDAQNAVAELSFVLALQGAGANSHTKIKPLYDVYTTYLPSQVSRELTKRIAAAKNEITRPVGRVSGLVDVVFVVQ